METLNSQLVTPISPTLKQRNEFFDALFYDVSALTREEKDALSPFIDREGSVINVPPTAAHRPITHYPSASAFLNKHQKTVQAIVVAGVGSSVLGTAALARNVANAYGIDAAGIVSGYGASDVLTEALGGWFFYGATDEMRHEIREALNRLSKTLPTLNSASNLPQEASNATSSELFSNDIDTLNEILDAFPSKLSILVGHSKGDLLIDRALERFAEKNANNAHRYFEELRIVTFGSVTDIPDKFKKVYQFIGSIDWFGGINSRLHIPHIKVPNAWHHLNTSLPYHLPAETILKQFVSIQ